VPRISNPIRKRVLSENGPAARPSAHISSYLTAQRLRTHVGGYLETSGRTGVGPDSVQVLGETLGIGGCPLVSLVWLFHGLRSRRAPCRERLERGLLGSK
jgi:hypothetical protein